MISKGFHERSITLKPTRVATQQGQLRFQTGVAPVLVFNVNSLSFDKFGSRGWDRTSDQLVNQLPL